MGGNGRDKTTFNFHTDWLYCFAPMRSSLRNDLSTFQRTIYAALSVVKLQFAKVYLDDIFVFYCAPAEHINHFRQVLTQIAEAGVALKLKNVTWAWKLLTTSYTSSTRGVSKLRRVRRIPLKKGLRAQRSVIKLKSFEGPCNVFWSFVPNVSEIPSPFNDTFWKGQPFHVLRNDKEPDTM